MKFFKNGLVLTLAFLLSLSTVQAQGESFREGDLLISPGISLGYYYGNTFTVPLSLSVEVGLSEFIGIGAFADYAQYSYRYPGFASYNITSIGFGALGSFHYWGLIDELAEGLDLKSDVFDLYATLTLGYRVTTENWEGSNIPPTTNNEIDAFGLGGYFGGRYYLTEKFAIFAEGGRGFSGNSRFGLTIRL